MSKQAFVDLKILICANLKSSGSQDFPTRGTLDQSMFQPKGGLIGPKNLGDFWGFSLMFNGILMPIWGFNYSKMAKYRFLIDPNTFWMILGTSKISKFFGPVVDPGTPYLS